MKNFGLVGLGGYVAPKHLKAIKNTGNNLVCALDKNDSVGVIDSYFKDVKFFTEFERFDRHIYKLKRLNEGKEIDFLSICTPNYLHDAHIRLALRNGADAICEKPLVLNPWNIEQLKDLEEETGKKVYTVLQLRVHPKIIELKKKFENIKEKQDIELTYITPRGDWYFNSWKADITKSGGIASNIGIHFFDMLLWIFGKTVTNEVFLNDPKKMSGFLELEKARVKWYLSVDRNDLPVQNQEKNQAYRSITIDKEEIEFSGGFTDLHTRVYDDILNGKGYGLDAAYPSINIVSDIRTSEVKPFNKENAHPMLVK
jgi:UDP-N-acetyl-2-amino-2-deoxyglucuronate dehydrogenase